MEDPHVRYLSGTSLAVFGDGWSEGELYLLTRRLHRMDLVEIRFDMQRCKDTSPDSLISYIAGSRTLKKVTFNIDSNYHLLYGAIENTSITDLSLTSWMTMAPDDEKAIANSGHIKRLSMYRCYDPTVYNSIPHLHFIQLFLSSIRKLIDDLGVVQELTIESCAWADDNDVLQICRDLVKKNITSFSIQGTTYKNELKTSSPGSDVWITIEM